MQSCDWPTVCLLWYWIHAVDICSYTPKYANQFTLKQMHDQQIIYLSSNQRRTHMVRFLCCFAVNVASNIMRIYRLPLFVVTEKWLVSSCHGSTISSADFLWKLNHAHKSWSNLSIVWRRLNARWLPVLQPPLVSNNSNCSLKVLSFGSSEMTWVTNSNIGGTVSQCVMKVLCGHCA